MEIGVGLYDVFLSQKNSSNKFEIKIVSKNKDRWGSGEILEVVVGWSVWWEYGWGM